MNEEREIENGWMGCYQKEGGHGMPHPEVTSEQRLEKVIGRTYGYPE